MLDLLFFASVFELKHARVNRRTDPKKPSPIEHNYNEATPLIAAPASHALSDIIIRKLNSVPSNHSNFGTVELYKFH